MGFKNEEECALASPQFELIPAEKPVAKLRVISAVANSPARDIHRSLFADENLNWWQSAGKALRHADVRVEALRVRDRVFAILGVF